MAWISDEAKIKMIDNIICNTIEFGVESVDYYKGVIDAIGVITDYKDEEVESNNYGGV